MKYLELVFAVFVAIFLRDTNSYLFISRTTRSSASSFSFPSLRIAKKIVLRRRYTLPSITKTTLQMSAGELHTGYEWLARQKSVSLGKSNGKTSTYAITWIDIMPIDIVDESDDIDPTATVSNGKENKEDLSTFTETDNSDVKELPLYPLNAVHLPSSHNHTLNNIEPQNIKMAQDLMMQLYGGYFVTTLKAADSGRIASVGTLMHVVDTEERRSYDGKLLSIRVQCQSSGLVKIERIVNPLCWTKEKKLKQSDEYLLATVRRLRSDIKDELNNETNKITMRLAKDYTIVRSLYADRDGLAARELPPFAIDAVLNNLPPMSAANFDASQESFWAAAEIWQMLCNTIREGRRSNLQSEVNEITIDAAIKKGGPLKLPVHRSNVPLEVQSRLNKMEEEAATNWVSLGMDPIIDFQILLSCDGSLDHRIRHLGTMVSRERKRIEAKQSLKRVFDATYAESTSEATDTVDHIDDFNSTTIFKGIFQ